MTQIFSKVARRSHGGQQYKESEDKMKHALRFYWYCDCLRIFGHCLLFFILVNFVQEIVAPDRCGRRRRRYHPYSLLFIVYIGLVYLFPFRVLIYFGIVYLCKKTETTKSQRRRQASERYSFKLTLRNPADHFEHSFLLSSISLSILFSLLPHTQDGTTNESFSVFFFCIGFSLPF